MGNTPIHGPAKLGCNLNILPAKVLTQSSLYPLCIKQHYGEASGTLSSDKTKCADRNDTPDHPECKKSLEKRALKQNDFHLLKIMKVDQFGKTYLVEKADDKKMYIMKIISKKKICTLKCLEAIQNEKTTLEKANCPFIPKLKYNFENDKKIFFVFEYVDGKRLDIMVFHLTRFSEEMTKLYSAEILVTLEYLYKKMKLRLRDYEAKNFRLDQEGHVNFIDFFLSKTLSLEEKSDKKSPSTKLTDFWDFLIDSKGCLIYELLTGQKLFENDEDIEQVLKGRSFQGKRINQNFVWEKYISKNARDLITRLLSSKGIERYGYNNIEEIKKHPFFNEIKWRKIEQKLVYPPIDPAHIINKTENEIRSELDTTNICDLDEIVTKKHRDITPDTAKGESFDNGFNTYNHLED